MTLWVHVHGGYPSYEGTGHSWGQQEYDAYKLAQALKGRKINGYATLKKVDGKWININAQNSDPAFDLWGLWASARAHEIAPEGALLVPVPSADCLNTGDDEKGRKLATSIVAHLPAFAVAEALCWNVQYPKASQGGPRDFATLFENIRVDTSFENKQVILVDDVVTGGGHLQAAASAMRWAGHKVEHAICVARTVYGPPSGGMFKIPVWDLDAPPAWPFPSLSA